MGLPIVTTVHGFTTGDWKNQLYQVLQRLAFRRFDAVVAVSRTAAERAVRSGARPTRVHVIPNAYSPLATRRERSEARAVLGIAESGFRFGWVGRIDHDKGLDVLLEALALIPDQTWELSVVGDGPDRTRLMRQAEALGLGSRIRWHGAVPGAGSLMTALDALVLSSRTEGTPMVLLEAMAAGVPVVTTVVGGIPDVVGDAEALLVPPEQPAALATALCSLLSDPEAARARANDARERLRGFDTAAWLDRYDQLYRSLAGTRLAGVGPT